MNIEKSRDDCSRGCRNHCDSHLNSDFFWVHAFFLNALKWYLNKNINSDIIYSPFCQILSNLYGLLSSAEHERLYFEEWRYPFTCIGFVPIQLKWTGTGVVLLPTFFIWNDKRVSTWWHNFHFWNYTCLYKEVLMRRWHHFDLYRNVLEEETCQGRIQCIHCTERDRQRVTWWEKNRANCVVSLCRDKLAQGHGYCYSQTSLKVLSDQPSFLLTA